LTADVGLIRVVVRRFAPSNHADAYPPPRSAGAKRPHYKWLCSFGLSTTIRRGWQELFDPAGIYQQYNIHRQPSNPGNPALLAVPGNSPVATRRG